MMVVQGPFDFNLLLSRDYVYVIRALVSSLFCLICFAHEGRIVAVDQLSFVGPNFTHDQPSSPNVPCMKMVSPPPQVNYVATYPMPTFSDSAIVHHVLGALDPDFQDDFLPSDENLLEAMTSYSS